MRIAAARRMSRADGPEHERPLSPATREGLALSLHQLRRALREPRRLRRLHYSVVLAGFRALVEPAERDFVCRLFGIDADAFQRLETDLLGDVAFARAIESRHRDVRGTAIRLFGPTAAQDHDRTHRLLYYCTRLARPRIVVETGVFDGLGSALVLKALEDSQCGRLCS